MKALYSQIRFAPGILAVVISCSFASAQISSNAQQEDLTGIAVREIHPKSVAAPFPMDKISGRSAMLEFRTPDKMTTADRELAEASEAEIARRAALQGFYLRSNSAGIASGPAGWDFEQAVCPVFPEHLILEYSHSNGPGDVTLFSVVIPRANGHVRVIPVRRRGYSLLTPSSSNALTINDFNHMVTEGRSGLPADWLTLGLCYAALAGGHVRASLQAQTPDEEAYPLFGPAKLIVDEKNTAEVSFADISPRRKAMDWKLTFAQSGRLLKVQHTASLSVVERSVVGAATEVKGIPVKGSVVDLNKLGN